MAIYTEATEEKIRKLRREIVILDEKKDDLEHQIEKLQVGECPIRPGDIVQWESGKNTKRGIVRSIQPDWAGGYSYRCSVLGKDNRLIGFARISDQNQLEIIKSAKPKTYPKKFMPKCPKVKSGDQSQ